MPLGFDPQRPPGMFPWLDLAESRIPLALYYLFSAVGTVAGYFVGLSQGTIPLPLCAGLGLLLGLLLVPLLLKSLSFLLCSVLMVGAAIATFWMMDGSTQRPHPSVSIVHASKTAHKTLDQLFPGGR